MLEEESEIKRFSLTLFYTKAGDTCTLLDHNKKELGSFTQQFDQDDKTFYVHDFNLSYASLNQLQEYLSFQMMVPISCHAKKVKMDKFPLKKKMIQTVLEFFVREYKEGFTIDSLRENGDMCDIEITIKQPKRTHYIQQAYLRNFSSNKTEWLADNKKEKARIFVYDKIRDLIVNVGNTPIEKTYGQRIESIAFEEYFYSLGLEKYISDTLEKQLPPIFEKILTSRTITSLTLEDKKTITTYLILTWIRSKDMREYLKESYEKSLMTTINIAPDIDAPENAEPVINEDYLRFLHESLIWDYIDETKKENLIDRIVPFKWLLLEERGKQFFFTSDNPVVFHNSYYEKEKRNSNDFIAKIREESLKKLKADNQIVAGLMLTSDHPEWSPGVEGVEIYFPINPTYCLILIDWQKGSKKLNPMQINERIILEANNYIYSHQSDFRLPQKMLRSRPEMRIKAEKRVKVKKILTEKKDRKGLYKFKAINLHDLNN